jgi:hypothetical protein
MFKMATGVSALVVAGLLGLACVSQAGLSPGGESGGAGGVANGGQTSGVAGGSGGTVSVGGIVAGSSGGTIGSGGVSAGGNGTGGAGGTSACLPTACPALACVGGSRPNPEPCGCPICAPNPDAGVTKDAGGRDAPICPGPVPPCAPPPETCPAGYEINSPPCGCTSCAPVDGGTVADAGKKDAPICPPVNCPALLCVTGIQPSPEPCGCPICADAGVASPDAALACCPTRFLLYGCKGPDGGAGFACHNPALGCASSLTCGQGCDPQVSGPCVPDQDAGAKPPLDAQPACVDNVLCINGDHFDTTLCKCVPDTPPTASCSKATDCTGALPALCEKCANGSAGCAHFTCVAGQCQVAYCS